MITSRELLGVRESKIGNLVKSKLDKRSPNFSAGKMVYVVKVDLRRAVVEHVNLLHQYFMLRKRRLVRCPKSIFYKHTNLIFLTEILLW